jgi:hypothetical protein
MSAGFHKSEPVSDLLRVWQWHLETSHAPLTVETYLRVIRRLTAEVEPTKATKAQMSAWLVDLKRNGYAPSTLAHHYQCIAASLPGWSRKGSGGTTQWTVSLRRRSPSSRSPSSGTATAEAAERVQRVDLHGQAGRRHLAALPGHRHAEGRVVRASGRRC